MDRHILSPLSIVLALFLLCAPALAAQKVAVITDGAIIPPAAHGLAKLEQSLRAKGYELADPAGADYLILAGVRSPNGEITKALNGLKALLPDGPEALTIQRANYRGKPAVFLCGADARGLMYAALDTAERISWTTGTGSPLQNLRDVSEKPYLTERGVSIYTMQRAYFESRLYDEQYWRRYFDMLAASRINTFVVIFGYENGGFMAPLYPYFFDVDGFPGVQLVGITREQQARNTEAFKAMMKLAHERGIDVTAGIWDHIYRGGVQGGGIPGASETAGQRVPGLVWGVTGENLGAYTKAALRRFLAVFPEVDAIQFRMHDESGLKKDEMAGFWHEVFALIKQARPDMRIDLRAKGLPDAVIEDALDQGLKARVNTKQWMEQMGLPFHPTHINVQNQRERRHSYADMLRYPQRYRVHWQLWSGGTTRLLLWGDPDYVRRFAQGSRLYDGNSFEVNEMLATKMLGEPHDAAPRDVLNPSYRHYDYEFERYWHFYQLWGRLTYNPQTPPEIWEKEFTQRFGPQAGPRVMNAMHLASKVLPRIVASSYRYQYFPTTRGWPEMQRQGALPEFATEEGRDTQQFMNLRDGARSILQKTDTAMRRPEETSLWFARLSDSILAEVSQAEKAIGNRAGNEFQTSVSDLKILAALARYHSWRQLAGLYYNLYKESGDLTSFDEAIVNEKRAIQAWGDIVGAAGDIYSDNLAFGVADTGFPRHWKEELGLLQREFGQLEAERRSAQGRAGAAPARILVRGPNDKPPLAKLEPVSTAEPGRDVVVGAKVSAAAGVKWVRLRYRHLTQFEDYQTAEMRLDPQTGLHVGRIPASFIDPKWNLMYFVEVMDNKGFGRMYPDLETDIPYVVVSVKR
jgi:hypothetical protein